jgi:ribosomal protein L40E
MQREMALQACHECGAQISSEAKTCPQCGVAPKNKTNTASAIIGGIVAVGFIWFYFGGGLEKQAAQDMGKIQIQVARDMVDQYNIAKTSGTPIDVCVHAGMVSAAFLQAKDDYNYALWKRTESRDCDAAGMPHQ